MDNNECITSASEVKSEQEREYSGGGRSGGYNKETKVRWLKINSLSCKSEREGRSFVFVSFLFSFYLSALSREKNRYIVSKYWSGGGGGEGEGSTTEGVRESEFDSAGGGGQALS